MATSTRQSHFAGIVRAKLLDNKIAGRKPDSIRSLAHTMGNGSDKRATTHRRSLFKWMAPGEPRPSRESRALVAIALGNCEASELESDDEESDPVAALMEVIKRLVRDEIRSERGSLTWVA